MIRITIDTKAVNAELDRIKHTVVGMHTAMERIGNDLVSRIQMHLGHGETPWGQAFAPLKAKRGRRVGGIPLNDTRQHIYNRITYQAGSSSVEIGMLDGSTAPIGRVHQFGSSKKNIPPRPFLPIRNDAVDLPPGWENDIVETIKRHLSK